MRSRAYKDRQNAIRRLRRRTDPIYAKRERDRLKRRWATSQRARELHRIADAKYRSSPEFKEKRRAYSKSYEADNVKRIRARRRKNRQKPETRLKRRLYQIKYRATARGHAGLLAGAHKRRLRIDATFSPDAITAISRIRGSKRLKCFYCGSPISGGKCHIDHVKPLCDNGSHAAFNLVASCANCNQSKNRKNVNQFVRCQQLFIF